MAGWFESLVAGEEFCSHLSGQWQDSVLGLSWSLFLCILYKERMAYPSSMEEKQGKKQPMLEV